MHAQGGQMDGINDNIQVKVAVALQPFMDLAVNRLSYLFEDVAFTVGDDFVRAQVPDSRNVREIEREISYALYREKIYADTLPMRTAFLQAVTQS